MREIWHTSTTKALLARQLLSASLYTYTPTTNLVELDGVLVGGDGGLLAALLGGEVLGRVGGAAVGAGESRDAGDGGLVSVYPNSTGCPRAWERTQAGKSGMGNLADLIRSAFMGLSGEF